jgi:hypothetical protein
MLSVDRALVTPAEVVPEVVECTGGRGDGHSMTEPGRRGVLERKHRVDCLV